MAWAITKAKWNQTLFKENLKKKTSKNTKESNTNSIRGKKRLIGSEGQPVGMRMNRFKENTGHGAQQ